nr:hypothetical protein [Neobacillus sp. Marseille-Q6967]
MIVGILAAGIILGGLTAGAVYFSKKNDQSKLKKENIPQRLGILNDVPLDSLLTKLNTALDDGYINQVKQRLLEENPKLTEDEFEWRLFELKRYFLLTNILKKAPMFSEKVDEVWHGMILFTQKYQTFSKRYLGKMIHHTPNTSQRPEPQERAFFDWVFSQLFTITEFSWKTWGSFFRHPLDTVILNDFREQPKAWLMEKYFKVTEENFEIVEYLVIQMKQQLLEAERMQQKDKKGSFKKQETFGEMTQLSMMMVFFSYYYFDDYWTYAKAYAGAEASKYTSGCSTAVFCGFASDGDGGGKGGHGHGDHGGSHCSSGSTCSSCGSGCGSS